MGRGEKEKGNKSCRDSGSAMALFLPMLRNLAEVRTVPAQVAASQVAGEEEARVMRSQIGSRPPWWAGRRYSWEHCEAIQVPTNPQVAVAKLARAGVSRVITAAVYFRGDYGSNYKSENLNMATPSSTQET